MKALKLLLITIFILAICSLSASARVNVTANKSDFPDPVIQGQLLNYTINISNIGNETARNITVQDYYPTNVSFVSVSSNALNDTNATSEGFSIANDTWILTNLTAGTSFILNVTVRVNELFVGTLTNIANITNYTNSTGVVAFVLNSSEATASSTTTTTVNGDARVVNLTIAKTDSPDPVEHGENLVYTITVTNDGNETAHNVTVVEFYDANVVFVSANPSPNVSNDTWFINVTNGSSTSIAVTVNVPSPFEGTLTNNVNISNYTNTTGTLFTANSSVTTFTASATTTVIPASFKGITKSGSSSGQNSDEREAAGLEAIKNQWKVAEDKECTPIYKCESWSECKNGKQTRICRDKLECGKALEVSRECSTTGHARAVEQKIIEDSVAKAKSKGNIPIGLIVILAILVPLAGYEYIQKKTKFSR